MKRPPFRVRLAAWFAAALALGLLAYGAAAYASVARALREGLDARLRDDLGRIEHGLTLRGGQVLVFLNIETGEAGPFVRVREARTGREAWLSPELRGARLPAAEAGTFFEGELAGGERVRGLCVRSERPGAELRVESMRPLAPVEAELREIATALAVAIPVAVAAAAVLGYLLARKALSPVDAMVAAARRIDVVKLSERLPGAEEVDELGRLAAAFNDLFARLDASFQQMRRFTADASHELRTPLTAIRTQAEVALRTGDAAGVREALESALEEACRLTRLAEGLLQLSRVDSGELRLDLREVRLDDLARSVVTLFAAVAEDKGVALAVDGAAPARVRGDAERLRQVVVNLVGNAIEHTDAGGRVTLRVEGRGGEAAVLVRDTGVGIAPEHQARIFDRFYRVDPARTRSTGGFGLGLAIARSLAEAHGGRIELESEPGRGSCFRLVLPAAGPTATTP